MLGLWAVLCVVSSERLQFQRVQNDGFANLKIQKLEKVKVEAISRAEAMRLRQRGLRFHEVEHHHFSQHSKQNGKLWQNLTDAAKIPFWKKGEKKESKAEEEEEEEGNSTLDTSLREALTPKTQIKPTRLGGFICAQFDLDLFALSGGAFPGLLGVGLLGDIHYQPSTRCFGWTAELYLMLSIGVGLWGMDFRISLVVIATLVVTERPLAAGDKDLVWELPPGFDTKHCMEKNPFKLIKRTSKEGWKFIYSHLLRKQYLKHAELQLEKYLQENQHEITAFQRYMSFIEPPVPVPAVLAQSRSRGMASEGIASVEIKGRWLEDALELEVILPDASAMGKVSEARVRLWTEMEEMFLSQETPPCSAAHCSFQLLDKRQRNGLKGIFAQVMLQAQQVYVVPLQLDRDDAEFSFSAPARQQISPPAATLSCQRLAVHLWNCEDSMIHEVKVTVQVGRIEEENIWQADELGEGAPWGISVPYDKSEANHGEIHEAMMQLKGRLDTIRLYELTNEKALAFIEDLRKARPEWCEQDRQRKSLWMQVGIASVAAAQQLHIKALTFILTKVMLSLQRSFRTQMEEHQADALRPMGLSKTLQVPEQLLGFIETLVQRFNPSVKECARQALRRSARTDVKTVLLRGFQKCAREDTMALRDIELEAVGPKKWKDFPKRSASVHSCSSKGFVSAASLDQCKAACEGDCNAVVFEAEGDEAGWCTIWTCSTWDGFPHDDSKVLSIFVPELDIRAPSSLEIFLSAPISAMKSALQQMARGDLEAAAGKVVVDQGVIGVWSDAVRQLWFEPTEWPSDVLKEGIFQPMLAKCILEAGGWINYVRARRFVQGEGRRELTVKVTYGQAKHKGTLYSRRSSTLLQNDFLGGSNRWMQSLTFEDVKARECRPLVSSTWIWQVPGKSAYFVRPDMVPVAQAFFAGYDQFVSKFQGYAEQVKTRILPKNSSKWKLSVLPYTTTDGRFLHRHLKKGEKDRLKIHKGDVATDDAVYNFPRAMEESSHRDDPNFFYNVGLSVANLYLRVLGDLQALFNLYFANHPDWDQTCESLPARFNLPFEMAQTSQTRASSKWRRNSRLLSSSSKEKLKLSHRAGATVSQPGEAFTEDDQAMIDNWHWVSKPYWLYKTSQRSEFLTQTPPTHGKDGWATAAAEVSRLEATVWPHIWCELTEQEWASLETELPEDADTGDEAALENLEELFAKEMPDTVAPVMEFNGFVADAKTVGNLLRSYPKSGCPLTMKEKEEKSVTWGTFQLRSSWDASIPVVVRCLTFLQTLTELLVDVEEQRLKEEGEVEVQKAEEGEATRNSQLDTVLDTIQRSMERWRTEGTMVQGLRNSLIVSWDSNFKNLTEAEEAATVEARRSFQESRRALESLLLQERARTREIGEHLERLFSSVSSRESLNKDEGQLHPMHIALRYVSALAEGALIRQKEVLSHFGRMATCIDVITKPRALPKKVLSEWTNEDLGTHTVELGQVQGVLKRFGVHPIGPDDGVELFFEEACRVPPGEAGVPKRLELDEARPECERVILSRALTVIFPGLVREFVHQYHEFRMQLKSLAVEPTKEGAQNMLKMLHLFVLNLGTGGRAYNMDIDFYKAFAYRQDGRLVGNLWSNLPSALREIAATLQTRKDTRTKWITESVAFRGKLKKAKRARVRELEDSKKVITTAVEGCICQERWTAYMWRNRNFIPHLVSFSGCTENRDHLARKLASSAAEGWKGVCKTKEDTRSISEHSCKTTYAECDPKDQAEKRKYQIWRAGDVMRADPVRLPLLQLDFYLHVDLRNRRADFCTPNFAALMIDTNWHWSMSSWLPYDLRRSACVGARIHPPGVSLQLTVCRHRALGGIVKHKRSSEWSLTGVAYLLSHYNVWGTGDGDMTHSWFGGSDNWGAKAGSIGWPNFIMADPGTWASSSAGSGYLSTPSVAASQSAFWFSLMAELASVYSLSEFSRNNTNSSKKVSTKTLVTMGVLSTWRIFQQYAVVPSSWGPFVTAKQALKTFAQMGTDMLTPFRNEHDVILSIKYSSQKSVRKLTLLKLIDDLSMEQLRTLFFQAKEHGAPVEDLWKIQTTSSINSPHLVRNMNGKMLQDLTSIYAEKAKQEVTFLYSRKPKHDVQSLFRRCPGRPLWYKVSQSRSPLYTFWKRESSAWVAPKLELGQVLMITKFDEDWYSVVDFAEEEDRYIPAKYLSSHMKLVEDVLSIMAENHMSPVKTRTLKAQEMEQVIGKASVATLECWGNHILSVQPDALEEVMKAENRNERHRSPNMACTSCTDEEALPFDYFSLSYVRSFMRENFEKILETVDDQEAFLHVFSRGERSRVVLNPKKREEVATSKSSYTDLGLSVLTRLGLPFIKLPGVFQIQPYIQMSVQYDVKELFRAFKAKIKGKAQSGARRNQVQQYLSRKQSCERCIDRGQAFCDRQEAAVAMNRVGLVSAMDTCEPKKSRLKEMCVSFQMSKGDLIFWGLSMKGFAGPSVFEQEMCPCYAAISGTPIRPRWVTHRESCADLSWPDDEVEALKRASKDRDWQSGFSMTGNQRLTLDQVNAVMPPIVDCAPGFRCCGLVQKKAESPQKVRCVEKDSLVARSSRLHRASKCKYFTPPDGGTWSHAEGQCKEDVLDGTWHWSGGKWESYDPTKDLEEEPPVASEFEDEEDGDAEL